MTKKEEKDLQSDIIEGRNPVLEAIRGGIDINKLFLCDGKSYKGLQSILDTAKEKGIPYIFADKNKLDEMSVTGHHQGVIAKASPAQYSELEDIFTYASKKEDKPFVFILDALEDPHNLGAVIRTAHEAGAHGVVISKRHSPGITPVVARTAAGACSHIPIVRVANISQTIERLKKEGMWFVCADMEGDIMYNHDFTSPIGIVIGNEGSGASPLVKKKCDFIVSIPMFGKVGSLNASVAAGILAYEVVRQRRFFI